MIEKTEETIKNGLQKKIATLDAQDEDKQNKKSVFRKREKINYEMIFIWLIVKISAIYINYTYYISSQCSLFLIFPVISSSKCRNFDIY